jgi:cation diffusion facilitator family transporter
MPDSKIKTDNAQIRSVTYLGLYVNVILAVIKIVVGVLACSVALVADGIHSISDMATDAAVLLGTYYGSKKPDSKHPYGHGRIETFAAAVISFVLIVVGGLMIQQASLRIAVTNNIESEMPVIGQAVLWVAIASVFSKEFIYRITRKVAIKTDSSALYANAWHHRSDALSSIAVVVGFIAMRYGYLNGDNIAAIAVGLMIILVGVKVFTKCLEELSERAVDSKTIEQIEQVIAAESRIKSWHKLRSRSVGREIFFDLHILVDPALNVADAHGIAEALERSMHRKISRPINVMIHVEPDYPAMRKEP